MEIDRFSTASSPDKDNQLRDLDVIERIAREANVVIVTPYVVVAVMAAVAFLWCMSRRAASTPARGRRWGIAALVCVLAVVAAGAEGVSNQRILEERHGALIAGLCREAADVVSSTNRQGLDLTRGRQVSAVCETDPSVTTNATALARAPSPRP